ncbi:MAG: hypothetical protein IJ613_03390 [Muribaculaceae bacterium]|nr:hypothetical protein [Muribaculaceae bacterium]
MMLYTDKPRNYRKAYPLALPPGTNLRHGYKLMDVLGQGTFDITYLAINQNDQQFAIKEFFYKPLCFRDGYNMIFGQMGFRAPNGHTYSYNLDSDRIYLIR